jgi:hypothetical protein
VTKEQDDAEAELEKLFGLVTTRIYVDRTLTREERSLLEAFTKLSPKTRKTLLKGARAWVKWEAQGKGKPK